MRQRVSPQQGNGGQGLGMQEYAPHGVTGTAQEPGERTPVSGTPTSGWAHLVIHRCQQQLPETPQRPVVDKEWHLPSSQRLLAVDADLREGREHVLGSLAAQPGQQVLPAGGPLHKAASARHACSWPPEMHGDAPLHPPAKCEGSRARLGEGHRTSAKQAVPFAGTALTASSAALCATHLQAHSLRWVEAAADHVVAVPVGVAGARLAAHDVIVEDGAQVGHDSAPEGQQTSAPPAEWCS